MSEWRFEFFHFELDPRDGGFLPYRLVLQGRATRNDGSESEDIAPIMRIHDLKTGTVHPSAPGGSDQDVMEDLGLATAHAAGLLITILHAERRLNSGVLSGRETFPLTGRFAFSWPATTPSRLSRPQMAVLRNGVDLTNLLTPPLLCGECSGTTFYLDGDASREVFTLTRVEDVARRTVGTGSLPVTRAICRRPCEAA